MCDLAFAVNKLVMPTTRLSRVNKSSPRRLVPRERGDARLQPASGLVQMASKKLGVINRARQYFKPAHILALNKSQVRLHMEYCCHLWSGAPQYPLDPFDRLQRRAARIVGDLVLCERLDHLALRRDVASLCVFYRIYHGECSDELYDIIPTIWMCGGPPQCDFQGAFFLVLRSCGMRFLLHTQ
ncbi:unnamed protein product [Leptidea sinapis]|uniref:Uncharacterized protein n=1 Tax=Leptidea sinapis TaxID=189913 RepID=A0A5E4R470_9NEOP|nr:unnamed protein product [Leptidea sinapis]